jgi:hypothetical protein
MLCRFSYAPTCPYVFFGVNQTTFCVDSTTTPSNNTITLHQSSGDIHPLPQVKSLYSCHLAWIDVVFFHHLTRSLASKSSEGEAFLSDVSTVALFLAAQLALYIMLKQLKMNKSTVNVD